MIPRWLCPVSPLSPEESAAADLFGPDDGSLRKQRRAGTLREVENFVLTMQKGRKVPKSHKDREVCDLPISLVQRN